MHDTIVTGGLGNVGQWIVEGLTQRGHTVTVLDIEHPGFRVEHARDDISFRGVDLTDLGEVEDVVQSVDPDNVVHLAAIPTMGRTSDLEVFENNVMASYNVFRSAGRVGADIAAASTESVYGMAYAEETWVPDYLPVDEEHPTRPEDEYGTSKLVSEEIAEMVSRRHGVQAASIRLTWIQYPGSYFCLNRRDDLAAGAHGFWSYLDVRDAASLFHTALEADFGGHEAFLATAENSYLERPTAEAIEEHFGYLPDQCELEGNDPVFTTQKAREMLDWAPSHSWETAADESADGPEFLDP